VRFGIREIVFTVMLAAIPVAAWWFVLRPNSRHNAEMMRQIESRQVKLQQLNRATATLGDLKAEIESLEKAIAFFRSRLPSEKEMDKVLREVWRLAETNELTTKSIRTLRPTNEGLLTEPGGPYAEQPIRMKLEGPFEGFYAFLLALEAQPRIMRLQKMTIDKMCKAGPSHVSAECDVTIFFERSSEGT